MNVTHIACPRWHGLLDFQEYMSKTVKRLHDKDGVLLIDNGAAVIHKCLSVAILGH